MNKTNLLKLSTYLDSLPDDYAHFDMINYFDGPDLDLEIKYARENGGVGSCGTAACAVGHGPSAGILFEDDLLDRSSGAPDWNTYCYRHFIDEDGAEWEWMFGPGWDRLDNTPKGAAKRIRWILAGNSVPLDIYDDPFLSEYADEGHVEMYQKA